MCVCVHNCATLLNKSLHYIYFWQERNSSECIAN